MRKLRVVDFVIAGVVVLVGVIAAIIVFKDDAVPVHQGPPVASGEGRTDSFAGYRLEPVEVPAKRGADVPVAFRIIDPAGKAATGFALNMTKQVHFFAVRDDLSVYRHVHPELDGEVWRTALSLPDGGRYRMYAEFVPPGGGRHPEPVVLGVPFEVPGDAAKAALPPPVAEVATESGYRVEVKSGLELPVRKSAKIRLAIRTPGGAPVDSLEPHLGAYGHVTAFHAEQLSTTHMHPVEMVGIPVVGGVLTFDVWFAETGTHRLFLEFRHGGALHTAAFTVTVA